MMDRSLSLRVRDSQPISEQDVWFHFAAAEVDSPRHGPFYESLLGSDAVHRLRALSVDSWSEEDRKAARAAAWARRYMYVAPLLATGLQWRTGLLGISELTDIRVRNHPGFLVAAPSRRLADLVRAVEAGRDVPADNFADGYRTIRPAFEPSKMRGFPVLVGESLKGPFTEVEGLTRLSCLLSKHMANEAVPSEVRVVMGLSSRVHEWRWF